MLNPLITSENMAFNTILSPLIRSAKQDDNYGASNIILPCPGS
jgi:hypothetical protein